MTILEKIQLHTLRLPSDMQREVLDFIDFLETRSVQSSPPNTDADRSGSCLDLAHKHGLVGCLQGAPADLATDVFQMQADFAEKVEQAFETMVEQAITQPGDRLDALMEDLHCRVRIGRQLSRDELNER